MITTLKRNALLASAVSLALITSQASALDFSGDVELNTDAVDTTGDMVFTQGGRVALNVTGKKSMGSTFVEGKGTLLALKDGGASTDDMWVKFGADNWSLQAGRFEAVNLFPMGKDTMVVYAGDGSASAYMANAGRGRSGDAGQFALVIDPAGGLKLELDTLWGSNGGNDQDPLSVIRPSVTYGADGWSVTAGLEKSAYTMDDNSEVDTTGFAITGNFSVAGGSVNVNLASLDNDDATTQTFGANATFGSFGLGFVQSTNDDGTNADDPSVTTVYGAYTMPLMVDGASLTLAASTSSADNAGTNDSATGLRARINYGF